MSYNGDVVKVVTKSGVDCNIRHGKGTYVYQNSYFKYEGDWVKGKKHGKGKFSLGDGGYYEGDFKEGAITGEGVRNWPDGREYDGSWVNGHMHGDGQWKDAAGNRYDGEFQDNKRWGRGRLALSNGTLYDGEFVNHLFDGNGAIRGEKNSWSYIGKWKAGKKHGKGQYRNSKTGENYNGSYENDLRHGLGRLEMKQTIYEGNWVRNEPAQRPSQIMFSLTEPPEIVEPPAPEAEPVAEAPPPQDSKANKKGKAAPEKAKPAAKSAAKEEEINGEAPLVLDKSKKIPSFFVCIRDVSGRICKQETGRCIRLKLSKWRKPGEEPLDESKEKYSFTVPAANEVDAKISSEELVPRCVTKEARLTKGRFQWKDLELSEETPAGLYQLTFSVDAVLFPRVTQPDTVSPLIRLIRL